MKPKPSILQIKLDKICSICLLTGRLRSPWWDRIKASLRQFLIRHRDKREGRNTSCVRHTTAQVLRHAQHPEKTVLSPWDLRKSMSCRNTKCCIYLLLLVIEVTPQFSKHELTWMFIRILTQLQWKIIVL